MDNGTGVDTRFDWLTPTRALNWGYAMYVVSAAKYRRTVQRQEALVVLKDYEILRRETLTARERIFVSGIREVAVLYSNGIPRKNNQLDREISAADKEKEQHEQHANDSESRNIWVRAAVRYAPHGLFAAIGVVIARVIGIVLPDEWIAATGKTLPQVVAAAGCAVLWMYVSKWWNDRCEARIDNHYNSRVLKAIELHESGRDQEIDKYTRDAAALWTEYTGKPIPKEWSSYRTIVKEEIRAAQILRRKKRELEASNFTRFLLEPARKAIDRWRRNRRKKNGAVSAQKNTPNATH